MYNFQWMSPSLHKNSKHDILWLQRHINNYSIFILIIIIILDQKLHLLYFLILIYELVYILIKVFYSNYNRRNKEQNISFSKTIIYIIYRQLYTPNKSPKLRPYFLSFQLLPIANNPTKRPNSVEIISRRNQSEVYALGGDLPGS